jgi:hypothetical protein
MQTVHTESTAQPVTTNFNFQNDRLTTQQAAHYAGVSEQFLRSNNVSKRHAIPYMKVGRKVFYLKADIDTWLFSNRVVSSVTV